MPTPLVFTYRNEIRTLNQRQTGVHDLKRTLNALTALVLATLLYNAGANSPRAQQTQNPAQQRPGDEEVLRISSDLVRMDVSILDADGRFVRGLKAENLQLLVDGKPQPISCFEHVRAGSDEEARLDSARRNTLPGSTPSSAAIPNTAGRTIVFFVDDVHTAEHSMIRVRKSLLRYVNEQIQERDQVAIFTTTGQLGFLQQFTSDKTILRTAINQLMYKALNKYERGEWRVPMDEFQALAVERRDRQVIDYFVGEMNKELPPPPESPGRRRAMGPRAAGNTKDKSYTERALEDRARRILQQAGQTSNATLRTLENFIRTIAPLSGRKLLFFMSDGFLAEGPWGTAPEQLKHITDAAARSGTVIYTIEARGLVTTNLEASQPGGYSLTGLPMTMRSNAVSIGQGPLSSLASMTGGRAMLNSNDLNIGINSGTLETSEYYHLAWQPAGGEGAGARFKQIELRVVGRPELRARLHQGFFNETPAATTKPDPKRKPEDYLFDALRSVIPLRQLATAVGAGYINDAAAGIVLVTSIEVDAATLGITNGVASQAELDVAVAVVNLEGKPVTGFEHYLTVKPRDVAAPTRPRVRYTQQMNVPAGRYQLRAAARDRRTGRTGSALQWIEIPDIKPKQFAMSSLFVGEVTAGAQVEPQAELRFARTAPLGFLVYIYNAGLASGRPDIALQVNVFRERETVISLPLLRLMGESEADLTRIPYGQKLSLESLSPGRYVLQVTASDRIAKTHSKQRTTFIVE